MDETAGDMAVVTEAGDTGMVTAVDRHRDQAFVRFPRGSGPADGWYRLAQLSEAADQARPPSIEHGDRPCPVCDAAPGEPCTMIHDRRQELQPQGRSHPERGGFEYAHEARQQASPDG